MRYCAHKHLLAQIWQFKSRTDLKKYVTVTKIKSALHHVPMLYPCKSGWNPSTSSWAMVHTSTFGLKFGSLSPAVTLKTRSRSPKPNQLIIMSQCYIHANSVKIHLPVHEISCKQGSVTLTLTLTPPTGSAPKTICPPPLPFGGGHKYHCHRRHHYVTRSTKVLCNVWSYDIYDMTLATE